MSEHDHQLNKRFIELSARASAQNRWTHTDFLSLAEQDALYRITPAELSASFTLYGGFDGAERRVAAFGSEDICGYTKNPPIICIKIAPRAPKFAESLTHRDFLGALVGLGIERRVLGDIVIQDDAAYLFCLDSIAGFITENLTQVRRTSVTCVELDAAPDIIAAVPDVVSVNVASERLDALVAAVFKLSRGDAQTLFGQDKIFVGGRLVSSPGRVPDAGDIVSVRGYGRFIYEGATRQTRKGRLFVDVRVY